MEDFFEGRTWKMINILTWIIMTMLFVGVGVTFFGLVVVHSANVQLFVCFYGWFNLSIIPIIDYRVHKKPVLGEYGYGKKNIKDDVSV